MWETRSVFHISGPTSLGKNRLRRRWPSRAANASHCVVVLRPTWHEGKNNIPELVPEIMATFFKAAVLRRRDRLKQIAEAAARRRRESSA